MEIDPNAVIAALGQQVGALAADSARLRVGLNTAEAELTKVTRERDEAQQAYQDASAAALARTKEADLALARTRADHPDAAWSEPVEEVI